MARKTICFQTRARCNILNFIGAQHFGATQAYCFVCCSVFPFCLRYSALFSMDRLPPEWMPQALWVLKEVSLLWQCVDSPSFFEIHFLEHSWAFLLRFSLTCKRWSVSPLGQTARCLILLSMFLMHFSQLLVVRLHYFKCLMGKYCCGPSHSYLLCCCLEL